MIKPFVPTSTSISVYKSIIEPYFDYCKIVWGNISDRLTDKLQDLQNRAARVITGADYLTPINEFLSKRQSQREEKQTKSSHDIKNY